MALLFEKTGAKADQEGIAAPLPRSAAKHPQCLPPYQSSRKNQAEISPGQPLPARHRPDSPVPAFAAPAPLAERTAQLEKAAAPHTEAAPELT